MSTRTLLLLVSLLTACAGPKHEGPRSKLRLSGSPAAATVLIDEQPLGTLAEVGKLGVALPPGQHRLTVQADGYFPADVLLEVDDRGGVLEQKVELVALPEP